MKTLIPLTKIGFFNPGRLTDHEIEQLFFARIPFFNYLLQKIVSEKPRSIPQQHLVIGQRGMGKSTLLSRIAAEIRKPQYKSDFIALSFPEEQYNVDRLSKFWLNCLDALADALDKEGTVKDLLELDKDIAALSIDNQLDPDVAFEKFDYWLNKIGRRPILLVDNLDLIFSKISKEDQHKLRALLMSKGAPILVGASSVAVNETVDYQAPFYDAFQISYLNKLSFQESFDVLLNLARITGNDFFQKNIFTKKPRLNALYQLTGGTPRTLAILFPLIQNGFSDQLQTDLDALLDMVTPLYKARFEELPPQLQVVLDAVALHWDPITIQKLREITMLDNAQLSPQLKRLVDIGWLNRLDAFKAKGGAFEVNERFFNIWYLMRRSSRRQKRELYCLTKFLESFYGSDLRNFALQRMNCKSINADHIALYLALAEAMKDGKLRYELRKKGFNDLVDAAAKNQQLLKEFSIPAEVGRQLLEDTYEQYKTLAQEGRYDDARKYLDKILIIYPNDFMLLSLLASHNYYIDEEYEKSKVLYKKIINFDEKISYGWSRLGEVLTTTREFNDAEQAFNQALKINNKDLSALKGLATVFIAKNNRFKDAEKYLLKATKVNAKDSGTFLLLGELYTKKLKLYNKAEVALKKAIELDDVDYIPLEALGDLYRTYLRKFDLAEKAYLDAIKINDQPIGSMISLSILYMNNLKKYTDAEKILLDGLKTEPNNIGVLDALGYLYTHHLPNFDKAKGMYDKIIALDSTLVHSYIGMGELYSKMSSKENEAVDWFKKAIDLNPDDAYTFAILGAFYTLKKNFAEAENWYLKALTKDPEILLALNNLASLYAFELGRFNDAETLLKRASEVDPNNHESWSVLGELYVSHFEDFEKAEKYYEEALKLDPENYSYLNVIGNLNSDYLHNYNKAEKAYREAIKAEPENEVATYNLIFLLRDKLGLINEARKLFESLSKSKLIKDSYLLHQSLFAYYDKNVGVAENYLSEALQTVEDNIPEFTTDDWYRTFAIILKLNQAESLHNVFNQTGHDILLKPLSVALDALGFYKDKDYISSVAAEVREPADRIYKKLSKFMNYQV